MIEIIGNWNHIITKAKEARNLRLEGREDEANAIIKEIEEYSKQCDKIQLPITRGEL